MHVWISETTEQGIRDLGADLDYTRFVRGREDPSSSLQQIRTNLSFDSDIADFSVTLPPPDPSLFPPPLRPDRPPNPPVNPPGIQTQSGAGLNFSIIENNSRTIGGVFRTIEQSSDTDVISKPELLVIEGMTATIQAGDKVPFQNIEFSGGKDQLVVGFKEIGVNMEVTPTIRPDNLIQLHIVKLDVTDLLGFVAVGRLELPLVSTRSQTGVVLVPNG